MTKPIAENKQTIATELSAQLMQSPFDAKFYDVTFDESGNPIKEEIDQAVETAVMIQVKLN